MKNLQTLVPFLKQHSVELLIGFVFMLLQNYGYMKVPAYMQKAVDEISAANRFDVIFSHLLMIGFYTVLLVVSMFLMRKLIIGVSRKIEYQLREKLYQKLLAVDMAFFLKNETGDLVSRCTNDVGEVRTLLGPGLMYIPNSLSRVVLFIPILFGLSAPLLLIILGMLVFVVALILMTMPRLRPLFRQIQEFLGVINNRVWQVIAGMTTIKLYTLEAIETDRFKDLNQEYIQRQMQLVKARGFLWPLFIFIFSLTELFILWIGGSQVIREQMTIGELLQFNVMVGQLTFPVLSLGWVLSLFQQGISAMGRINYILEYPVEQRDDWQPIESETLMFRTHNLTYRYPAHQTENAQSEPRPDTRDDQVLRQINVTIRPGQIVGITGTIGSGKTTFINLLTGLYKPEPGMLFINDVDIRDIQPESLLRKISVVPQETFLFSRSIAENVSLGNNGQVEMEAVREAVSWAGLESDVITFPEQYDQVVGERGITLSGGQKQRTAIARALRKRSPVLMFDDALSSVDANTEARILDNLKTLHSFQTFIVVSHRISALKNADVIYVFDQGAIVEQGTHEALLNKQGLYSKLARMQQMQMDMEAI
ncbi:ABC transporter related [Candidatus Vecturithrix granuli]|uniref:ABC transporter related n=1 Tax=Vecturithrix granuli TaxID=1499967 RepID=A0A0S6W744_VECG1|nr:ABC transporter related [Candidatus Vecturithrix granuli]